jgi:hypothetical protein
MLFFGAEGQGEKGRGFEFYDADVSDDVSKSLLIVLVKVCNRETNQIIAS